MAWLRILAVFAAVVLLTVGLRLMPPILVLLVVVAGTWTLARRLRAEQKLEQRSGAELLGLRRELSDPFGIAAYPLQLFSRSGGAKVDEVAYGPWRGLEVRVFGATVDAPELLRVGDATEAAGPTTPIAGVLTNIAEDVPAVVIEPEVFATMFERPPSLSRVPTGDPSFDRVWAVWSDDAEFARALLTDALRPWLASLGDAWGVELSARIAMVYGRRPSKPDLVSVLEILGGFLRRVPQDLFPSRPPAV